MFLQVIWNNNLKQTSLIVSSTESYEDYPIIISFPLKEDMSTTFIQNFIACPQFEFLYIEDKFLWLENYHLTKNILAFFNVLDFIELNEEHLHIINQFIHNQHLPTNDFENLGFQSPVKTIPRDLKSNPSFMRAFLNIADVSKRLLRTTFDFNDNVFIVTINKREITPQHFFNHLNSDRDRLRIKESLAYSFENTEDFVSYISGLNIFIDKIKENTIELFISGDISTDNLKSENDTFVVEAEKDNNEINTLPEKVLKKDDIIHLNLYSFLSSDISVEDYNENNQLDNNKTENNPIEPHSKIEDVLENFNENQENHNDFFSTERTYEDYSLPETLPSIEEYDNSVFIEQKIEENKQSSVDINSVEEELTEEFLVEIETNLQKHERSLIDVSNDVEEDEDSDNNELQVISVDDLVDSINNIIEEPELTLELIDIIDLPIILFLSEPKIIISDSFIDSYFVNSDVNEEINQFSAEEVLHVVKTEVSIFENTVSDKKKKSGKHKKDKLSNIKKEDILDIIQEDIVEIFPEKIIDIIIEPSIIQEEDINDTFLNQKIINEPIDNILKKIDNIDLPLIYFLNFAQLKQPLLIHSIESLTIIEFIVQADIVEDSLIIETDEQNFNFFEDNKKKLIELSMAGELELIDELYRNYPEFEKPLLNFNYEGDNPVCIASFYENIDLLKKLIDYGWDANYFDSNLNNALIIAAAEGHKHIVRYLLTQNIQINFQNKIGYTALHFAVNDCNHRIVKLLIDAGADVEISDNDRNTALSIAAFKGDINSTKLLLQTRVNVHTKNKKGYDARSIALIAKNHAIAKLIEDKIVSERHNHSLPPIIEKTFEKNT